MKKLIAGLILSLSAAMAFALPSPKQIEQALAAGDYQSAQSMTQEVLREKPDSPKAHLFNAFLLAKQGNKVAANEELNNVNRLDHTDGKVVQNSALYGRTVAELERAPAARVQPRQAYVAPAPVAVRTTSYTTPVAAPVAVQAAPVKSGIGFFGWMMILLVVGVIAYVIYKMQEAKRDRQEAKHRAMLAEIREASNRAVSVSRSRVYDDPAPRRATSYTNQGRTYDAPPHAIPAATPQASTVVVNNSGDHSSGMLQGMMLNEMMHSHHHGHSHRSHDDYGSTRVVERERVYDTAPEPVYEAPKPSYESKAASYSSGSDNSWNSSNDDDKWGSSSSSSSSSNWGSSSSSSSWDSGSSSSSYDSGSSSSDSGSSGGGDW